MKQVTNTPSGSPTFSYFFLSTISAQVTGIGGMSLAVTQILKIYANVPVTTGMNSLCLCVILDLWRLCRLKTRLRRCQNSCKYKLNIGVVVLIEDGVAFDLQVNTPVK